LDSTSNYTLASYRHQYNNSHRTSNSSPYQYIHTFPNHDKGGHHITDHIPVAVTFSSNLHSTPLSKRYSSKIVNSPEFRATVQRLWNENPHSTSKFAALAHLQNIFADAHAQLRALPPTKPTPNECLWDAVHILHTTDPQGVLNRKFIVENYPTHHKIHSLIPKDGNPAALLNYVNTEFATNAYDANTRITLDKLTAISRSLPSCKKSITALKDTDDSITDNPARINTLLANFWKNKWVHTATRNSDTLFRIYNKVIKCAPTEITEAFVHTVIAKTNDSAVGPDDIPFEVYRATADIAAPVILSCIHSLMDGDPPPPTFNGGLLYVLPKKPTLLVEDTRPLVVNNTDNRIISTAIRESITPSVDTILSSDQHGFRSNMSVDSNIEFFNEKFYSALDNSKFYDIMLVDFKKAFDSVSHTAIFSLIKQIGLPLGYCNAIQALFYNAYCLTTTDRSNPIRIDFHAGVKQGCPLSPTLFILLMDVLHDMITNTITVHIRLYADDVAIGSSNLVPHLPKLKMIFKTFAAATGLHLNTAKTVCVSTGGRSHLRAALDAIGWSDLMIVGSTKYLGIPIGHSANLDEVFTPCHDKLVQRVCDYTHSGSKKNFSIPKRVQVWNTWLLPIYSFASKFFLLPKDFLHATNVISSAWLSKGNSIKGNHLIRPKHLLGTSPALRSANIANLSTLISLASPRSTNCNMRSWSMRISTQRTLACIMANHNYNLNIRPGTTAKKVYSTILNSHHFNNIHRTYINRKCNTMGLSHADTTTLLNNRVRTPAWVPNYANFVIVSLTHNMLFTDERAHRENKGCRLCPHAADSTKHTFGDCSTARDAINCVYKQLNLPLIPPNNFFSHLLGADLAIAPPDVALRTMLANSIWRARAEAGQGADRDSSGWKNWIVEDCLTRISNINPSFFDTSYANNFIKPSYKITRKANLGSSSSTPEQKAIARKVIATHLERLPNDVRFIFTDGSAKPNPGPAGSGVVVASTTNPSKFIHACAAALGHTSNNAGEIIAIGIGIELCVNDNYARDIHVYTDSLIIHNALRYNHGAGPENARLIQHLRQSIRDYMYNTNSTVHFHRIPGHSGIPLNDTADKLAKAGARVSKNYDTDFDPVDIIINHGFSHLINLTSLAAPWAKSINFINSCAPAPHITLPASGLAADLRSAVIC
jgi:ribonuclease HI